MNQPPDQSPPSRQRLILLAGVSALALLAITALAFSNRAANSPTFSSRIVASETPRTTPIPQGAPLRPSTQADGVRWQGELPPTYLVLSRYCRLANQVRAIEGGRTDYQICDVPLLGATTDPQLAEALFINVIGWSPIPEPVGLNWTALRWEAYWENQPLALAAFPTLDAPDGKLYAVVVDRLRAGRYTLRVVMHVDQDLGEGQTKLPRGSYTAWVQINIGREQYETPCPPLAVAPITALPARLTPDPTFNAAPGSLGLGFMPARCSLQIIEIVGRGAADRAGLRVGDEIIAIDGDASVAVSRFAELRSGQVVTLTILRDGTTFALQLAAQP